MTFESLGLAAPLLRAVESLGYTAPTEVQMQTVPAALMGGDLMVSSQTGSGKTAAFLLPMLHQIILAQEQEQQREQAAYAHSANSNPTNPDEAGAQAANAAPAAPKKKPHGKSRGAGFQRGPTTPSLLVLCPTRELAEQVSADAINLIRHTKGIRVAMVIGGMPYGKQMEALQGAQIVVATPGRLLDLENKNNIKLNKVRSLVVDEADRMLDLGFAEDLEAIHELTSDREQTMMFSATFEGRIMKLAANVMREPSMITVGSAQEKHQDITQTLHWADNIDHKKKILDHWLRDVAVEQAVVFVSTQIDSESLAEELTNQGHSVVAMHGAMPQFIRQRRLKGLREGKTRVLVATDVAARGLDVPTISHVFNYGLPMKVEDYVHRIGRTGRAGRSGVAVTLADHRERFKIKDIERYTRQPIQAVAIPGLEPKLSSESRNGKRGSSDGKFGGGGGKFDRRPSSGGYAGKAGNGGNSGGGRFGERTAAPRQEQRFENSGKPSFSADRAPRTEFAPRTEYAGKPREYSDRNQFNQAPQNAFPAGKPRRFDSAAGSAAGSASGSLGGKTFGERDSNGYAPPAKDRAFADRGFAPKSYADRAPTEGKYGRKPAGGGGAFAPKSAPKFGDRKTGGGSFADNRPPARSFDEKKFAPRQDAGNGGFATPKRTAGTPHGEGAAAPAKGAFGAPRRTGAGAGAGARFGAPRTGGFRGAGVR
jgi:superfamily II DNA/RNA helicase